MRRLRGLAFLAMVWSTAQAADGNPCGVVVSQGSIETDGGTVIELKHMPPRPFDAFVDAYMRCTTDMQNTLSTHECRIAVGKFDWLYGGNGIYPVSAQFLRAFTMDCEGFGRDALAAGRTRILKAVRERGEGLRGIGSK